MKKTLTAQFVKNVKEAKERQRFVDAATPNLILIVQPTGKKVWTWNGSFGGKTRTATLGTYPAFELAAAREWACDINDARLRGDPFPSDKPEETAEPIIDPRAHMDCDWLFDLYMTGEGGKKKSGDQKRAMYNREVKPIIGSRHIDTITHDDLANILQKKFEAGYPVASNRIKALLSRWWRWSVTKGRTPSGLKDDPARDLVCLSEEQGCKRALSDYEIGVFFQGLASIEETFAETLTVILYTGMRRGEAFGLRWDEVDLEKRTISIDGERIKNGLPLVLGLPDTVITILSERKARTGNYTYVWPSPKSWSEDDEDEDDMTKTVTGWGKPVNGLNVACQEIAEKDGKSLARFTIHDLRRTLSTGMHGLMGPDRRPLIASDIVERVINHRIGGVRGVYNRWEYFAEKEEALRLWAQHLDPIRTDALATIERNRTEATSSQPNLWAEV